MKRTDINTNKIILKPGELELKRLLEQQKLMLNRIDEIKNRYSYCKGQYLLLYKKGNTRNYYVGGKVNGKEVRYYVNKSNKSAVRDIATYKISSKLCDNLNSNIKILESALENMKPTDYQDIMYSLAQAYQTECPDIAKISCDAEARLWKEKMEEYKKGFPIYKKEHLTHHTEDGTTVRSKSEALIYDLLMHMGITFVYELPLWLDDGTQLLPDFTVYVNPHRIFYIEHAGSYYDEKSRAEVNKKMYAYFRNGVVQNKDLLFTFDDVSGHVDISHIHYQVRCMIDFQ